MKHFTLLAVLCLLAWQGNAQILNQAASWPNATWTLSGLYDPLAFVADPTGGDSNFSYDDDEAGNGSNDDAINAESPVIDLTAASSGGETWITVEYDYSHNDIGGSLDLQYYDVDAALWVTWENLGGNSALLVDWCPEIAAPTIMSATLDISGFTATQLTGFQYRLAYNDGNNWQYGFCVSSPTISSAAPPACLDPSALTVANVTSTGADFGWTDNSGSGLANIEYGPTGFALGTGTPITGTANNPEVVGGLTPNTGYQFYIQSDCGGGNISAWFGPFSFTTNCASITPYYLQDFATFLPGPCWDEANAGTVATGPSAFGAGNWQAGTAIGTTARVNLYSSNFTSDWTISPYFDLSLGGYEVVLDVAVTNWNSGDPDAMGSDDAVTIAYSEDGITWTALMSWTAADALPNTLTNFNATIPSTGPNVQFGILASDGTINDVEDYDFHFDNFEVREIPSCPAPGPFSIVAADTNSAEFVWTENGSATTWELEYGPVGFIPGTGTVQVTTQNPDSIVGLTPNTFYDVYITSVCGPTDSSFIVGPVVFNTYNQGQYMDWNNECGLGFIDISATGTATNMPDDGELGVLLPFSLLYQGTLTSDVTIGENGGLLIGTQAGVLGFGNGAIGGAQDGVYAFWDDLDIGSGNIYYETVGTAPNRTFIVQWDNQSYWLSVVNEVITYQVHIDEATGEIYSIYDDSEFGGSFVGFDNGASATIGLAGPNQDIDVSFNDATYLTNNSCIRYYYTDCPTPVNYSVTYVTTDEAAITWGSGLAGETNWTVIYGPCGFDPGVSGTVVQTATPVLIIPGLDDLTCYEVYIFADCSPSLQSISITGTFTTLPNCADPTAFGATTAVDSLMTGWAWTENVGYPSVGFDIEYGWTGFAPGTGTMVGLDNNFTDTTQDVSLLAGGVYQVYLQTLCPSDSSNWVGPITFVMPLTNDTVCGAEMLAVDGTVYTFDNTGATVTAAEIAEVTPPTTGFNGTNLPQLGWGPLSVTLEHTTWYTFVAPASGSMTYSGVDEGFFASQVAIYESDSSCSVLSAMNLVAASDQTDAPMAFKIAPDFTICGLTPGQTYYILNDSWSNGGAGLLGQYSISLTEIVLEAGTDNGLADICLGDTIDLFTNITGNDAGGVWTEDIPTANFNDPIFVSAGLASQVFGFNYVVTEGCAADTITTTVEIYAPSSAGTDGTITACQNEPIDLLDGLGGNVDLGGTWYDPLNVVIGNTAITSAAIPGQYNYDYITGNGVCPDDTANIIVDVLFDCDYLNLQDLFFNGMDIHPNPTTGMVYISNDGSSEVFNMELTDLQGKVIATQAAAINGTETTEVNLANLETGIYMIRLFNDNAEKTFRVVKQ